jgi:CMP-N,N'-diacetyllegionaminic acid synthase
MSKTLFLIPARAGSKGLPQKNIKNLCGKPLISYSIEFALQNYTKNDVICISTNDLNVIDIATKQFQINVPFIRSEELSSDKASTFDVIFDALKFYEKKDCFFEKILLLQPTSPYRIQSDFEKINEIYNHTDADMVVSVKKSKESPYFTLFEESKNGYLNKVIENSLFTNRQDCPPVYTYNGSMYLVNAKKFIEKKNFNFQKIVKYEMPESRSIDIDTQLDWLLAEYYQNSYNENN